MVRGSQKIMSRKRDKKLALFDRASDPKEEQDQFAQAAAGGPEPAGLRTQFEEARRRHRELAMSFGEAEWTHAEDSHREEIEALGYIM